MIIPNEALDREVYVVMTVRELAEWEAFKRGVATDPSDWIDTRSAAAILGEHDRKVRRLANQWERQAAAGRSPAVRVRRKTDNPQSHLLLHREDCKAYATRHL